MRFQLVIVAATATLPAMAANSPSSTASVWLPGWDSASWSNLEGTIVTTIDGATSYSVFCRPQTDDGCLMIGPVTFTEGPKTLNYQYDDSTVSVGIQCSFDGTIAATCTGSTSRSSTTSGLSQSVVSSTVYTGSELQWVALVLTTPPAATTTLDITASVTDSINPTDTSSANPQTNTPGNRGSSGASGGQQASLAAALCLSLALGIGLVL